MAAKMQQKRARTSADTAAPRGTVCGKPAYATGAFPTLAPALVRRRPRQTSRRPRRPAHSRAATSIVESPSRRWRGEPLVRFKMSRVDGVSGARSSLMASRSRRWRADGVEVPGDDRTSMPVRQAPGAGRQAAVERGAPKSPEAIPGEGNNIKTTIKITQNHQSQEGRNQTPTRDSTRSSA